VVTASGEQIALYDCRKPSIILSHALGRHSPSPGEELNDLDVTLTGGRTLISTCDDSGLGHVFSLEPDHTFAPVHTLKNKHSNICFRARFDGDHFLYTCAFDYKLVQWNLQDLSKSQSRNVFDLLSKSYGPEAMQYNPPFIYSMAAFTCPKKGSR